MGVAEAVIFCVAFLTVAGLAATAIAYAVKWANARIEANAQGARADVNEAAARASEARRVDEAARHDRIVGGLHNEIDSLEHDLSASGDPRPRVAALRRLLSGDDPAPAAPSGAAPAVPLKPAPAL